MAEKERVYTIPLRKEFLKVPGYKRSKKAVKAVRQFISKHMKVDDVKIGSHLNLEIWKSGKRNPPGKVKVRTHVDEKDNKKFAKVELFGAPEEEKKVEEKKGLKDRVKERIGGKKEVKEEKKQENLEKTEVKEEKLPKKEKEEKNIRKSDQETSGPK